MFHKARKLNVPVYLQDVRKWLQKCNIFQRFQMIRRTSPYRDRGLPAKPNQVLAADIVEPSRIRGQQLPFRYILVITDVFSKHVVTKALSRTSWNGVLTALNQWSHKFGKPREICWDNTSFFREINLLSFLSKQSIKMRFRSTFIHRSNGLVELMNQALWKRTKA